MASWFQFDQPRPPLSGSVCPRIAHEPASAHQENAEKEVASEKEVVAAWVDERTGPRGTRFTGLYRDPEGNKRSAGTFHSRREALRSANRQEQQVLAGSRHDASQRAITFHDYVEREWLPHKHLESIVPSTRRVLAAIAASSSFSSSRRIV